MLSDAHVRGGLSPALSAQSQCEVRAALRKQEAEFRPGMPDLTASSPSPSGLSAPYRLGSGRAHQQTVEAATSKAASAPVVTRVGRGKPLRTSEHSPTQPLVHIAACQRKAGLEQAHFVDKKPKAGMKEMAQWLNSHLLVRVTTAIINTRTKSNMADERVRFIFQCLGHSPSLRGKRAGTQGRNLLLMACSGYFLMPSRTAYSGVTLTLVSWALPH